MITKRDWFIALAAICATLIATLGIAALAQTRKPLMGSSVFDWNTLEAKPTKVGARRDVFQAPTATLADIECHVTTLNAGEMAHAPHQHPDEELVIVKEGTIEVHTGGLTKTVGPGSVIFHASNQMHGMQNVGKTTATYYVLRWKSPGMLKEATKE
jgi:mannose-6-phosphate isomerase-like protein (cupin superfamily)